MAWLQIIGGLGLLFFGGEALVRGAVALAKTLGMSTLIIGLTVVAFGTSSPELVVSINAAIDGHPSIALGNVIGSNISNILLVLGVAALIYPIKIDKKLAGIDGISMVLATIALIGFCWTSHYLGWIEGLLLLVGVFFYTFFTFKVAVSKKDKLPEAQTKEIEEQVQIQLTTPKAIVFTLAGGVLLVLGADVLVDGAVSIAYMFGLSEAVIGVTIVAIGSSAPELATSIVASIRKHSDIATGNIIGSNLFNILAILGITPLLMPIPVEQRFLNFDLWVVFAVTIALFLVLKFRATMSRTVGLIFLLGYVTYIALQFVDKIG